MRKRRRKEGQNEVTKNEKREGGKKTGKERGEKGMVREILCLWKNKENKNVFNDKEKTLKDTRRKNQDKKI